MGRAVCPIAVGLLMAAWLIVCASGVYCRITSLQQLDRHRTNVLLQAGLSD
jgi:hypothetical protein